jgi:small subunit ribosomal protein S2
MPFVNERWLGGMLTNFATISSRTGKLREYEAMERAGDFEAMPKKEGLRHRRELEKLRRNLGGIRDLDRLPDTVFVIDTKKEHIAVTEANKLGMPIVAVVDTNCDPDVITYVIPGNDDAIRSGALMCRVLAEAVMEGRWVAEHQRAVAPPAPPASPARGQLRRAGAGTTGTLDPTPPGSAETAPPDPAPAGEAAAEPGTAPTGPDASTAGASADDASAGAPGPTVTAPTEAPPTEPEPTEPPSTEPATASAPAEAPLSAVAESSTPIGAASAPGPTTEAASVDAAGSPAEAG